MLEEIALSISTALFFLCAFVVNGVLPQERAETAVPCEVVEYESIEDNFSLVGTWNSGGREFKFTKSGQLIYNGQTMSYTKDGDAVNVSAAIDGITKNDTPRGTKRNYSLKLEVLSERVMKLNGVTLYRTE